MPTRIATGTLETYNGLKAMILAHPETVESGFRILDADLKAGDAGVIDLLGLDRSGALTLVAFAVPDLDAALMQLLDQSRWAMAERELLSRAYSLPLTPTDPAGRPAIRCILLAARFSHMFLARLGQLAVDVTPFLARRIDASGERQFLVEAAAPIFGLEETAAHAQTRSVETEDVSQEEQHAGPADDTLPSFLAEEFNRSIGPPGFTPLEELSVLDSAPAQSPREGDRHPYPEPLSEEEMAEFEQFERQRRSHHGGSS